MKQWMVLLLGAGLMVACTNSDKTVDAGNEMQDTLQEAVVDAEVTMVQQSFPTLFDYLKKQDATFSSDSFLLSGESEPETIPATPIDEARLKPFQKYLIYNSDSSRALDLYSYNYVVVSRNGENRLEEGSPDSEAAVLDLKANTRKRIFFGGPSYALWDAKWVKPDELLLIGAELHENDKIIPTIWHINLQDASIQVYAYQGEVKADISSYKNEKLRASVP